MIKAIYPNAKEFHSLLSGLNEIVDEVILNFSEDGIFSRYLTDDKTLMGILRISKEFLEEYTIEKPIGIKVKIDDLKKILGKAKSKNAVVELEETDAGLKVVVRDEKTGLRSNIYVKGEKTSLDQLTEPKVNLSVSFTCEGKVLKRIIDDVSIISEEVEVSAGENNEIIFSTEEGGKSYRAVLVQDKPLKSLNIESAGKAIYSVEVLKSALKGVAFSENVTVSFGNNIPMKIEASASSGGQLIFWVAPRL
ncbi:MAG: DNA polymerase sliding clamp [Sulfolobus sp.]|jgi:proliferating cell nuclear antigen|nr:DNA polymerase sliding clamp [Sulfolobaceae archaeon]